MLSNTKGMLNIKFRIVSAGWEILMCSERDIEEGKLIANVIS